MHPLSNEHRSPPLRFFVFSPLHFLLFELLSLSSLRTFRTLPIFTPSFLYPLTQPCFSRSPVLLALLPRLHVVFVFVLIYVFQSYILLFRMHPL